MTAPALAALGAVFVNDAPGSTGQATGNYARTAGRGYLVAVVTQNSITADPAVPTLAGTGFVGQLIGSVQCRPPAGANRARLTLFWGVAGSTSNTPLTVSYPAVDATTSVLVAPLEVTNFDAGSPWVASNVQTAGNQTLSIPSTTSFNTMNALAHVDNRVASFAYINGFPGTGFTFEANYTRLFFGGSATAPTQELIGGWRNNATPDLSPAITDTVTGAGGWIAGQLSVEIRGAGTLTTPAGTVATTLASFTGAATGTAGAPTVPGAVLAQAQGAVVTNATGAAQSVAWPTHQANDIGILVVEGGGDSTVQPAPSGWSQIGDVRDVASSAGSRLRVYWRRASGSAEPNVTTYATADHQLARIVTFRGAIETGSPVDDMATGTKAVASTTAILPSVDTTVLAAMVVWVAGRPDDSASTTHFGTPVNAGLTAIDAGAEAGTTNGNGGGFVIAWGTMATPGTVGTTTMTKSASTTDTLATFALKPQPIITDPDPDPDEPGPEIPAAGRITLAVGPRAGTRPSQVVTQYEALSITNNLVAGPKVGFTMAANSPAAQAIAGLKSDLWVYKHGVLWRRLRILPVAQGWPENGVGDVTINAVGYKQVASARHIRSGPPTFDGVDQGDIGWALIAHTQAQVGGFLGITKGTTLTGQPRIRTEYQIGDPLGTLMNDLGQVLNGMHWEITEQLVYNARLWTNFPTHAQVVMHGGNARNAERNPSDKFGNAAGAVGDRKVTVPKWVEATDLALDDRGLWEQWDASHASAIEQATVDEYATGLLANSLHPPGNWKITLNPDAFFEKGSDYEEGDFITIKVPSDIVDVSTPSTTVVAQVTEIAIKGTSGGITDVTLAAVELSSIEDDPDEPPPVPDPPVLVAPPVLSVSGGIWQVGLPWNTTNGVWTGAASFAYQWQQSTTPTGPWTNAAASAPGGGSATSAVYRPPIADAGKYYRAQVTATGPGGVGVAVSNVQQSVAEPAPILTLVPPDGFCWWGTHAAQDGTNGNFNAAGYSTWRGFARRYADALHFYVASAAGWNGTINSTWQTLAELHPDGTSILVINWKIASNMSRAAVAAGGNDAILDAWAANIVDWPHRLLVLLDHEYDNNTWSANNQGTDHANACRHWVLRSRQQGVDNVEFGWCVTGYSGQAGNPNGIRYNQMWWGDDVTDWLCYDPYWSGVGSLDYARGGTATAPRNLLNENFNTQGGQWRGTDTWAKTPKTVGVNGLAYPFAGHKPICLAEWGGWYSAGQITDTDGGPRFRSVGPQWADDPQVKMLLQYNNLNSIADTRLQGRPLSSDAYGDTGELSQFNYGIDNAP